MGYAKYCQPRRIFQFTVRSIHIQGHSGLFERLQEIDMKRLVGLLEEGIRAGVETQGALQGDIYISRLDWMNGW